MNARTLLVMSSPQRHQLLTLLEESGLEVFVASGFQDARHKLSGAAGYDLLFVAAELPDGSWRDLLQFVIESRKTCEMIVCARHGDERLWAEVIQCGAFDLIAEPYEEREIARIVRNALDSQYMRRFLRPAVAQAS